MKKFLVLYQSTASAEQQMAQATPEQMKAGMDMWMKWAQKAGPSIVDLGSPVGKAMNFASAGKPSKGTSMAGGYSVLQADSLDALGTVLQGHPHFMAPGASIEVLEMMPMPGM